MLQAMNTGHDGSLSTVHANSPRDALARIETMVLMAGYDLPVRAIRQQIASALDMVVHLERLQDGSRRVTAVTEVQGMESDVITLQDLFSFKIDSFSPDGTVVGALRSTGLRPVFVDQVRASRHRSSQQPLPRGCRDHSRVEDRAKPAMKRLLAIHRRPRGDPRRLCSAPESTAVVVTGGQSGRIPGSRLHPDAARSRRSSTTEGRQGQGERRAPSTISPSCQPATSRARRRRSS